MEVLGGSSRLRLKWCRGEFRVTHASVFLEEVREIASQLSSEGVEDLCAELVKLRERDGRLFLIGVGGSAGNCSHAVNDFRKLCGIEAYAPTDNVSELTARTNDEGWQTVFAEWLKVSRANAKDALMVFSVGGGNLEKNVSPNIVRAIQEAKTRGMKVLGIVGRDGGYTKKAGDVVVVIPTVEASRVTPHAEAFQAVVWHCLVSHPKLQQNATKW
jgi:D-sedoheptulose 7-phosphate isomerase